MDTDQPLYILIGENDINHQRIAAVEKLFGFASSKLMAPKRVLVGEGVLTKICRRKPKLRHFFLFNDVLLYGRLHMHRKLGHPQFIDLAEAAVEDICDNGIYRNGLAIMSPKKSFTVYASTAEEKTQWMSHLKKCIAEARVLSGNPARDAVKHSPIWIPDAEASHCMVCRTTEFTLMHRRHHCRNCGKVVCHKCSTYRWILPYQGSSRVRVCSECHAELQAQRQQVRERTPTKVETSPIQATNEPSLLTTPPVGSQDADRRNTRFFTQEELSLEPLIQEPTYLYDARSTDDLNTDSDSDSTG